jgi:hypothetical protein
MNTNIRNTSLRMILAGLCALASAVPGRVQADSIAGLYPTGAGGTPGQADLNYTLVQAPAGVSLNTVIPSVVPSSWYVPPGASWSGLADNANQGFPVGEYTYQLTFDLVNSSGTALDPTTASISGLLEVDDLCTVQLNGNVVGQAPNNYADFGFTQLSTLDINSGFVSGQNTLDFVVDNIGNQGNPTGLLVDELSGTADILNPQSVPEPGDLVVLGIGLSLLVFYYRFHRPVKMVAPIKLDPSTARRFHNTRRH